jgi:CheY-like chemotaxis protein
MPLTDGYVATPAIRAKEQAFSAKRLRIVALTVDAFESDRQGCLDAGQDKYSAKPILFDQLAQIVSG